MKRLRLAPLFLMLVACGLPKMPGASRPAIYSSTPSNTLLVGAARADITPPPGASTFGMGPDARVADGIWTRLYCRAFVLETTPGGPIAIVPCDLAAVSTLLQRSVAERVKDILPASRLMMTATHTHAGPAHYFEGRYFGDILSSQLPGFDPDMVAFLANRIAMAVRTAYEHRVPAVMRWGHDQDGMWGLTRNRALGAFAHNENAAFPTVPADYENLLPEMKAIDPGLDVVRIDEVDSVGHPCGPIGAIAFFAMHPTVMPTDNTLFDADTHGIVSRILEASMRTERGSCPGSAPRDPLFGVVNTNEGDITPNWIFGTQREVIRIGTEIAKRVQHTLANASPAEKVVLDIRYVEENLPDAPLDDSSKTLCDEPAVGMEFARGACDHRSDFTWWLPWTHVMCQGKKQVVFGNAQFLATGKGAFPSHVPLAVVRLGDTLISFVPAEMTVNAGMRLRRAVRGAYGDPALHSVIAGLANGYILYVTTHEEYALARYEGAATLYGPNTAEWLAEHYAALTRSLRVEVPALRSKLGVAAEFDYDTGPVRARLLTIEDGRSFADLYAERRPLGLCKHTRPDKTSGLCFWWLDAEPGQVGLTMEPWLQVVGGYDRVPASPLSSGLLLDDRGWVFTTRAHDRYEGKVIWSTTFELSDESWADLDKRGRFRIRVRDARGYPAIDSELFGGNLISPQCAQDAVSLCFPGERNEHKRDLEAETKCSGSPPPAAQK